MTPSDSAGRIESLNGVQIYFEVHGTGLPLLLLHGFTGSGEDWKGTVAGWQSEFQLIVPDLHGHGRSGALTKPFRHRDAAADMLALLDQLNLRTCRGVGISGGGNVLLHMAAMEPDRIESMVLVSATPYFPSQARAIMRDYPKSLTAGQWESLRRSHPGGDAQVQALIDSTAAFAQSYDDMNFTPPLLSTIRARTLIVQGDRDPLYPVELSFEMAKSIPKSALWIVPQSGHSPVIGARWAEFLQMSMKFLRE